MSSNDILVDQTTPPAEQPSSGGSAAFAPAEIAGITAPMIGRDDELQRLIGALYTVIEGGSSRLVSVVGPAGIGKSRLAHEFRQLIGRLPEPVVLVTLQADRQSAGQPYSLLRLLVAALFRIREGDPPAVVRARLERGVAFLLGPDSAEKAHFIGQLAGYDLADSPYLRGSLAEPRQLRDRALHYAAQCLKTFTAHTPVVLLLDDFHYADASSIDAVAQVVRDSSAMSLLVICLAQQRLYERRPGWDRAVGKAGERVDLSPLDERAGRRLVAEILRKAGKLPSDLRNLIVSRADGNPFYVEELIKMLIADGVIVPGAAAWTVQQGRLSRLRIPATLGDLLRTRVQMLAPDEREFLVRAAVIGRFFWAEAVLHLDDRSSHDQPVEALLATLEARELIAPLAESRFAGQREYAFRHELLHEVVYDQLPPELRERYHQRVAEWLSERSGERTEAYAGLIAEHYERGGRPACAANWYARAGQHARETYAVDTAIQRFQTALALLPDGPDTYADRIICHEGLGQAQLAVARVADAIASFAQMAAVAAATGDRTTEARALNLRAYALDSLLDYAASKADAQRAIVLAEAAGDRKQHGRGLYQLAYAEMRFERAEESRALTERALQILEAISDGEGISLCQSLLGLLYEMRNDFPAAMRYLGESLAYNRATGNLTEVTIQLNNLGYMANVRGDYAAALALLREGQAIGREIGSRVGEIYLLSNIGFALNGLGDYAAAEAESRHGIELSELSRMPVFADFYCALSAAHLGQGRVTEALEAAHQALDTARDSEGPREVASAWRALGRAISAMSDSQGAPACFAESARLFDEIRARGELARSLRAWAEHELRRGDPARGRELWAQARAIFAETGLVHELHRTPEAPPAFER